MLLRYSLGLAEEADCIERAVDDVLNAGFRTADIMGAEQGTPLSCTEMTERILKAL